jgi:hypothetical protein
MPENQRRKIPEAQKRRLWVVAGGRCEYCNKYLLEDERTARRFDLGELAHNVGQSKAPGSPRGEADLLVESRDLAENLLLLCRDDHAMIDKALFRGEFTVERLRQIKRMHEDRIQLLTGLNEDQQTVVLRVIGDVRGAAVELSKESARRAVLANAGRYPLFSLAPAGEDIEIDLRGIPCEGSSDYWVAATKRIDDAIEHRVRYGVRDGLIRHLSLFALARIPLLVYAGYQLDDKVPLDIYQRHRAGAEGWQWEKPTTAVAFEHVRVRSGADPTAVALTVSLSGSVNPAELPPEIDERCTIYDLRPAGIPPSRDILRTAAALSSFTGAYHAFLAALETAMPDCREISLFPAVPVSAAVVLGRGLMREAHPALVVYDRSSDSYERALEVNR